MKLYVFAETPEGKNGNNTSSDQRSFMKMKKSTLERDGCVIS